MAPQSVVYIIDACSLLELPRRYPRPNFNAVWELIEKLVADGRLFSVEDVAIELSAQEDEMAAWAEAHKPIFLKLNKEMQLKVREILAAHPKLIDLKKKKSSADPFIIATAILWGATVVTEEKKSGGPPAEKIPDVCAAYLVPCVPMLKLLQQEGLAMG